MAYHVLVTNDGKDRKKTYDIRREVFIDEQHVPEALEIDEYDQQESTSYVLVTDDKKKVLGSARFRPYGAGVLKIERVAVLKKERRKGLGQVIMKAVEEEAKKAGYQCMKLAAQLHAKTFYEQMGFSAYGKIYLEAGIQHVDMLKNI